MNNRRTPRRRLRRLGIRMGMVAGVALMVFGLSMYFLTDTGAFERDLSEMEELRSRVDENVFEWKSGQVAWLRISGTHIDYPVMQTSDNKWYLSHDFLGRDSASGAVFLDYRNASDFSDKVAIIYGHRMNGNLMFSELAKYEDSGFLEEHREAILILRGGKRMRLEVAEFREIDAEDELYREIRISGYNEAVIVLSTCDRDMHEKRNIVILRQ